MRAKRNLKLNISLEGELNQVVEKSKFRIFLLLPIIVLTYAAIAVKASILSLSNFSFDFNFASEKAANIVQQVAVAPEKTIRKNIYDRNGILIASSLVTASLYAHPQEMIEKEYAAKLVHQKLPELSEEYIKQKFLSEKKFQWIKRNLTPKQKYEINALGIPGLFFEDEAKRLYPHKNLFAHVIGSVGVDSQGLSGMERVVDIIEKEKLDKQLASQDFINTTLDARIQNIVREELQKQMEKHQAVASAGIVMDANNGEILALVSLPDYEPNFLKSITTESFFNHATLGSYELGSVFKPITFAAAFENGAIEMNSKFDATQAIRIGRFAITDFHPENRVLTTPEVMMYSSNIGTARIAEQLGAEELKETFEKLGFYKKTDIEIQEKSNTNIPKNWGASSLFTISFGHGLAISPLHLITAFAPIVNGGTLYKPTLLKTDSLKEGEEVFSEETSDTMKKLLRLVVTKGTASKANIAGYLIGGKTGTAEKIDENGRYSKDSRVATFIGAFPMNKPQYLVLTLFDEPKASKDSYGYATAGWVAAPPAGKIISRMAPLLKIMPVDENDEQIKKQLEITGVEIR